MILKFKYYFNNNMPGGLLQIASSGIQDFYLTNKPEITFFKKIYRRHTNFSIQTNEISIDQEVNYGEMFFLNIPKFGDLIYRSFFKVELPVLKLDDSYITNTEYIQIKNNKLKRIEDKKNIWKKEYESLKKFSEIQIIFYQKVQKLLKSVDITYQNINNETLTLKNSYNNILQTVVFQIDEDIIDKIDIISYINNLDRKFGSEDNDNTNTITYETFLKNITTLYNNIIKQLVYYQSNMIYYKKKYDEISNGKIDYSWIKNLGHHYFSNFNVEIDGQFIESYTSDYFNIYQNHNIKDNELQNYNELIGNVESVNNLNSEKKNFDLYIPLIFWFNRSCTNSLPLVSMKHSEVNINITISDINKIIYFNDFNDEYNKLLILEIPYNEHVILDTKQPTSLWDSNNNLSYDDVDKVEYLDRERIYVYYFKKLKKEIVKIKYPNLTANEIDSLFTKYSSNNDDIMTLQDWINFRVNSESETNSSLIKVCKNLNYNKSPHFMNESFLVSKISKPKLTFFSEYIYLDELERDKFAKNNLEYVINLPNQITTNIDNNPFFTTDIDILKPTKDILWFIRPLLLKNGVTKFSHKDPNILNKSLQNKEIINNFKMMIHDIKLIDFSTYGKNYYLYASKHGKLNNTSNGLSYYYQSFSLYPEDDQPSGSSNFSAIKGKSVEISLNKDFLDEYFNTDINKNSQEIELIFINRSYNLLKFEKGKGTLIFY